MKKIIFVVVFTLVCQIVCASINRTIFGLTLGRSTKAEAIEVVMSKGLSIDGQLESHLGVIISASGRVEFAGYNWDNVSIVTKDNLVASIIFSKKSEDGDKIISMSQLLLDALNSKYAQYGKMEESTTAHGETYAKSSFVFREDPYTQITFEYDIDILSMSSISIMYIDVSYMQNGIKNHINEL